MKHVLCSLMGQLRGVSSNSGFGGRQDRFPTSRLTLGDMGGDFSPGGGTSQAPAIKGQMLLLGREPLSSGVGSTIVGCAMLSPSSLHPEHLPKSPAKMLARQHTDEYKSALYVATLHLSSLPQSGLLKPC